MKNLKEEYQKIYIAVCQDRHNDVVVRVFDTPEKAISYAKDFVQDNVSEIEDIQKFTAKGFIYNCKYSSEGDYVFVIEGELNRNEYK